MIKSSDPRTPWMLREIYQQPEALEATFRRYVGTDGFRADVCAPIRVWLRRGKREIVIAASGSSRHAGLVGKSMIEGLSGIAVDVNYASEYCYRSEKVSRQAAVLVISQSGETADTLAALRKANLAGHPTLSMTNAPDSSMATEAIASFPTDAGRERAIPATKSFTAQLLNLYLLSLLAAEMQGEITAAEGQGRLTELAQLPAKIGAQLPGWEVSPPAEYFGRLQAPLRRDSQPIVF